MIDSVKDIKIEETRAQIACMLNEIWHSRLPKLHWSNVVRSKHYVCYVFKYKEAIIGVGIWSSPVASNRFKKSSSMLELRRMALSNVCPKNTASFTISKMIKEIKIKFEDITRLISYQDKDVHNGTIYKASNWFVASEVPLLEWNTKTRKRNKLQSNSKKIRWEYQI
jgi:hypothetical protein|tara:strand:- start:5299 stop:5799 length:501 start_codon:yes stop_codon:yes gene_type:complete